MIKNFLKTKEFIGGFPKFDPVILSSEFCFSRFERRGLERFLRKARKKKEKKEGRIFRIRIERKFINRIYTGSEVNGKQREETTFRVKAGKR